VIALDGVAARRRPLALASVSLAWGPGVHAILGGREDVRTRVSMVPLDPSLPDALCVDETLALAAAIRAEPAREPSERLGVLGIEALAARPVRSLSLPEARAVALAEAVTSSRVRVLLVEEPLLSMDPRALARLPALLRARGADGCAIVVLTASHRDAGDLADDHVLLRRGAIVAQATSIDALSGGSPAGARLHVVAQDSHAARAIVAALVREEGIEGVAQDGASVVARGRDAVVLARTVGQAIVDAGVDVAEMRCNPFVELEAREAPALEAAK
jgi:ABC-2 type transport system ATP-binding protein